MLKSTWYTSGTGRLSPGSLHPQPCCVECRPLAHLWKTPIQLCRVLVCDPSFEYCSSDLKFLSTTWLRCRHSRTAMLDSVCTRHVRSSSNMKPKSLTVRRGIVMRPLWPLAHTARGWRCSGGWGGFWARIGCKDHKPPLK